MISHKRLGEILVEKGLISQERLREALEEQQKTKEFLGRLLIKNYGVKERDLLEALGEQFNMSVVSLKARYIDWKLVRKFSSSLVFDYKCIPLCRDERSITVAITNPLDLMTIKIAEEEALKLALELKLVLTTEADVEDVIQRYKKYIKGDISNILE